MSEPRVTCSECGEELWGFDEREGLCIRCKGREEDSDFQGCNPDDAYVIERHKQQGSQGSPPPPVPVEAKEALAMPESRESAMAFTKRLSVDRFMVLSGKKANESQAHALEQIAAQVFREGVDWADAWQKKEAPGGTGPSDEELREIWNDERWANQHMGNRFDLACRALYTRGRSDQAKASEAEIAALRTTMHTLRNRLATHPELSAEARMSLATLANDALVAS